MYGRKRHVKVKEKGAESVFNIGSVRVCMDVTTGKVTDHVSWEAHQGDPWQKPQELHFPKVSPPAFGG